MTTALEGVEGSASRPGRSLPSVNTRYPLYRRLGGPQDRSGQVRKISTATGIRSPDRPVRSQSLYRLRYPALQDYGSLINPLNVELNPIWHLLALLGVHHFLHVSRIRVKSLTLRLLMSATNFSYDLSRLNH